MKIITKGNKGSLRSVTVTAERFDEPEILDRVVEVAEGKKAHDPKLVAAVEDLCQTLDTVDGGVYDSLIRPVRLELSDG